MDMMTETNDDALDMETTAAHKEATGGRTTAAAVTVAVAADPPPPVAANTPPANDTGAATVPAGSCSDTSSSSPPPSSGASSSSASMQPHSPTNVNGVAPAQPPVAALSPSSSDSDSAQTTTPTAAPPDSAAVPSTIAMAERTLECDDFDVAASEASDDIRDAMTKTALCSCLFTLTRTGQLTLHQSNLLSKALCSSSSTLRAFEKLLMHVRVVEAEANTRQDGWLERQRDWNAKHKPKSRRSFFGLGPRTPTSSSAAAAVAFPEPSPQAEAKREGERLVWLWVAEQMAAIMPASSICNSLPVSPSNAGGAHRSLFSSSSPNMAQMLSAAGGSSGGSGSAHRPLLSSLQPVQILPDSAPHTRSHSVSGQGGMMMAMAAAAAAGGYPPQSGSNSPASTPRSPALSTSSSFAQHPGGQGPPPGLERAHSVLSPRRLFRALFYSSTGGASASASTASSNASTPKFGPTPSPNGLGHAAAQGGFGSPSLGYGSGPVPSPQSASSAQLRARGSGAGAGAGASSLEVESCAQHFDSFPRICDLLQELLLSPLPTAVLRGFEPPLPPISPVSPLARPLPLPSSPNAAADSDSTLPPAADSLGLQVHVDLHTPASPQLDSTPVSPSIPPAARPVPAAAAPAAPDAPPPSSSSSSSFPTADWLVLHAAFPYPVPSPLCGFELSPEERGSEAGVLAAWNDVLLNFRKHVPLSKLNAAAAAARGATAAAGKRFSSPAAVLLEWWLSSWDQAGASSGSWADDAHAQLAGARSHLGAVSSPPPSGFASPLSPGAGGGRGFAGGVTSPLALGTPAHTAAAAAAAAACETPISPPMFPASPPHLRLSCSDESEQREGEGEGAASPSRSTPASATPAHAAVSPGPSLRSTQLRLLVLLAHWLFLCPHDFNQDKNCMARLNTFLLEQQARFASPPTPGTGDAPVLPPVPPHAIPTHPVFDLLRQLQSMLLRCSSPSFQLDSSGRAVSGWASLSPSSSSSPLQLVSYPFSEEVDSQYSSSLFSHAPSSLAQELLLHSYDLFRRVPLAEWMDGAWQNKSSLAGGMPGNPAAAGAYWNAYSLATNPPPSDLEHGSDPAASAAAAPHSTATSTLIGDFNRLVFWMSTEILHPRLSPHQRQQVVLYFLELAFISWHVHHNFHVVFAVAATFANQAVYRLPEVAALESMELRYANAEVSRLAQEDARAAAEAAQDAANAADRGMNDEDCAAAAAVAASAAQAAAAAAAGTSVKSQFSELKALTSSRNNYATYRTLISTLLGEQLQQQQQQHSSTGGVGHSSGAWMGTTPCATSSAPTPSASVPSTPMLYPLSGGSSRRSSDSAHLGLASPAEVGFPSAAQAHAQQVPLAFPLLSEGSMAGPATPSGGSGAYRRRVVTLVPHLAVHLKDLTYSQELSGVEVQWMDEQVPQLHAPTTTTTLQVPSGSPMPASSPAPHASPLVSAPAPALLSCRFDRARWRRTTRLICQLLRFQSLPIFSTALSLHVPALYTLLQVHLLTHVLPESELQSLSFAIVPRVDRARVKQQQVQKKTLTALQEEGFM